MDRYATRTVIGTNPLTGETSPVEVTFPVNLPSDDRCDYLQTLWSTHVKFAGQDWKGPCYANVPGEIADDVAEAMEFMGAIVDTRNPITDGSGQVALFSKGYRAHGF
jgi:hypothetical protein